eukprot:jgi/Antlo1/486/1471
MFKKVSTIHRKTKLKKYPEMLVENAQGRIEIIFLRQMLVSTFLSTK